MSTLLPVTCSHFCLGTHRLDFQGHVPCLLPSRSVDLAFSVIMSLCPWGLDYLNPPNHYIVRPTAGHFKSMAHWVFKTTLGGRNQHPPALGLPYPAAKPPLPQPSKQIQALLWAGYTSPQRAHSRPAPYDPAAQGAHPWGLFRSQCPLSPSVSLLTIDLLFS